MGARTAIKYLFFTSLWIFAVVLIQPHWTVFEHEDLFKVIAKQLNQILSFLYDILLWEICITLSGCTLRFLFTLLIFY